MTTQSEHHENPAAPPSNRLARWLLGLSLLLCVLFAVVYFGSGGKIWIGPEKNFGPSKSNEIYNGPIFIVEGEEDAKRLTDVYGVGINRGLSGTRKRDDVRIHFCKLYYEKHDDEHLICGEVSWICRPYHGYPGNIKWVVTTMDEIQANWDDLLHKYHPDARYRWHPDLKAKFEEELKPYRYPPQGEP